MVNTAKHHILIVEDNEQLLNMLGSVLRTDEIEVHTAISVEKGLEALQSLPISLVLLDWSFRTPGAPALDADVFHGKPVLDKCREIDPLMPVVVMSSYDTIDVADVALASGATSFISKMPLKVSATQAHIRALLRLYESGRGPGRVNSVADIKPLAEAEREYVQAVVELLDGNQSKAAEKLQITRQTVAKLCKPDDTTAVPDELADAGE